MRSSLACNKTRGSDLVSREGFPAAQHILDCVMSRHPTFAAADTAWICKTDIKDGLGQRAVCVFHRMVGILQAGAESGLSDVFSMSSLGSFSCKLS